MMCMVIPRKVLGRADHKCFLLQLFASSELESKEFYEMEDLANHMGLFLQKTNIIRDYLEDIKEEPAPRQGLLQDVPAS